MWLGPTAELVSGGAAPTVKLPCGPLKFVPTPRKLFDGVEIDGDVEDWTTGSGDDDDGCCGMNVSRVAGSSLGLVWGEAGGMLLNGGDVSRCVACITVTPLPWSLLSSPCDAPAGDEAVT